MHGRHEAAWLGGGPSGPGKTTLLERLIPLLCRRGLTVSTIKHAHHDLDIDSPGRNSWRHREAGAREMVLASARRWVLMHEHRAAPEAELVALLAPGDARIVAVASDRPLDGLAVPVLPLDDTEAIAGFVVRHCGLDR